MLGILATTAIEKVLSCFLPNTNIQFAWDSTSLELLKRCPRLYQYTMIDGYQPHGEAIHLRFGIEYHQALHDYETYKALGLSHDEAVYATVKELLTRIYPWDPDPHTASEEKKSKKNLVRTVIWYLEKFKDDPAKTVILANGKPALEVSFRFELDFGPVQSSWGNAVGEKVLVEHQNQPYLLCGHLDRIVNYQNEIFGMDRKTSVYQLTTYYFDQYHPNNQMSLYTIAGKVVLESPMRGIFIDAAQIHDDYSEFQRGITYRTSDQSAEWLGDLHYWFTMAESFAKANYWPMNDTACDKFGGCKFRSVCQKSPKARPVFLKSDFKQLPEEERWNPLKPR